MNKKITILISYANSDFEAIPTCQRAPGYKWSNSTTFYLVQMQDLVTVVAGSVGDVYPGKVRLVYQLVESNLSSLLQLDNLIKQAFVVGSGTDGNVSRFALDMLGSSDTAYCTVQSWGTISAIDGYRPTPRSPYRVQQLLNKPLHSQPGVSVRRVVNFLSLSRIRGAEFFDGKVFHIIHLD